MKFNNFNVPPTFFSISITQLELERVVDRRDELYSVAINAVY